MFRADDDNVWLQGLDITGSREGAVLVASKKKNVKFIDMTFDDNVNVNKNGGILNINFGATVEVIDSTFSSNVGSAIENWGDLTVVKSLFHDNEASPMSVSNDADERGGGVVSCHFRVFDTLGTCMYPTILNAAT